MEVVILDTNVFVAAGFKPKSAAAWVIEQVRTKRLRMAWHDQTRRETTHILRKIPPLSWADVEQLFREEDRFPGELAIETFSHISDYDDRKYAALADATGAMLLTNDSDLLEHRDSTRIAILTPAEFRNRSPR